jgi:hypothetical protein
MFRRILLAALSAGLVVGAAVAAPEVASAAAKPTITATGNVSCSITGKVKIDPPLTNQNTVPSNITGKLKGTCTGTTESGVSPTGVKIGITYAGTQPGTCNGLATPGNDPFTITATWKASGGKINQTTATLKGFAVSAVPNFGFDIPNPNAPAPRSTVAGSYAGTNNASAHAHIDVPDTSKCDPTTTPSGKVKPAKGIKKIAILDGSTLTIG